MMDTHDWGHILRGAVPACALAILAFVNITSKWKWLVLFAAMALAYALVYSKTKKKADLFTALAMVFLAALAVDFLQRAGLL